MATKLINIETAIAVIDDLLENGLRERSDAYDMLCNMSLRNEDPADVNGFMNVLFGKDWDKLDDELVTAMAGLATYDPESELWEEAFNVVEDFTNGRGSAYERMKATEALNATGVW